MRAMKRGQKKAAAVESFAEARLRQFKNNSGGSQGSGALEATRGAGGGTNMDYSPTRWP